jgi:hypothetical protein
VFSAHPTDRNELLHQGVIGGADHDCEVRFCGTITVEANGRSEVRKIDISELAGNVTPGKHEYHEHGYLCGEFYFFL